MSGLDVAGSVTGVAAAGMQVAKGLIEIAERIGGAGEEVRLCASDTALFSQMVGSLADALKMPTAAPRLIQSTTEDLVNVCEMALEPFQRLIARLTPLLDKCRENEQRLGRIGHRVQWYFVHRSKVTFYQQALQQVKPTLTCLLASMNLQEARASASQNLFICQMQVENSRASIDHQARADRAALLEPTSDLQVDWQLFLSGMDLTSESNVTENEGEWPVESEDKSTSTRIELEEADLQSMHGDIDNDPTHDTAIAVRIDLLALQRKVLKIAANALKLATPSTTRTEKPPALPSAYEHVTATDVSVGTSSPQKRFSMTEDWPLQSVIAFTEEPSALPPAEESLTKAISAGGSSPQRTPSTPENWPQTPPRRSSRSIPVTLTDPFGEKTALPYEACSTWASMQNTIKEVLAVHPSLEEDIASNNYTLYFNNDAFIPIQHWESLIAPGARVTLRTAHGPQRITDTRNVEATYIPSGASNGQSPRASRVKGLNALGKSKVPIIRHSTDRVDKIIGSTPFRKSKVSLVGDARDSKDEEDGKDQDDLPGQEEKKVRIIDATGGTYDVPFGLCRSFSNFEKILRKRIYPIEKAESKRYYDFFSEYDSRQDGYTLKPHVMRREDGTRIPPPKWKELIQPGKTVQVSFIDQDLTGKFRNQYGGKGKRRSWLVNPR